VSQAFALTTGSVVAAGSVLNGIPAFQDGLVGATAAFAATRLMLAYLERDGRAVADVHRRRIEAVSVVGGAAAGMTAYLLLG
jgi:hypothetical protein